MEQSKKIKDPDFLKIKPKYIVLVVEDEIV